MLVGGYGEEYHEDGTYEFDKTVVVDEKKKGKKKQPGDSTKGQLNAQRLLLMNSCYKGPRGHEGCCHKIFSMPLNEHTRHLKMTEPVTNGHGPIFKANFDAEAPGIGTSRTGAGGPIRQFRDHLKQCHNIENEDITYPFFKMINQCVKKEK